MATNKTMWVTGSAVFGLLLNAGLNFWFVDRMGYSGAAWATVLTTYGVVALLLFPIVQGFGNNALELFDWKHLFKVMAACVLPGLGVYFCMDVLALQGILGSSLAQPCMAFSCWQCTDSCAWRLYGTCLTSFGNAPKRTRLLDESRSAGVSRIRAHADVPAPEHSHDVEMPESHIVGVFSGTTRCQFPQCSHDFDGW